MKTLQNYINEVLSSNIAKIVKHAMLHIDYSRLQKIDQNDTNRFEISSENEEYICSLINDNNVVSVKEFYLSLNDKDYDAQSAREKANFGAKYGDIVFCNGKQFRDAVDIKIGETMFGAISLSSLNFFKGSTYLCINNAKKDFVLLSAEKLRKALNDDEFVSKYVGDNKFIKVQKLVNTGAVIDYLAV